MIDKKSLSRTGFIVSCSIAVVRRLRTNNFSIVNVFKKEACFTNEVMSITKGSNASFIGQDYKSNGTLLALGFCNWFSWQEMPISC